MEIDEWEKMFVPLKHPTADHGWSGCLYENGELGLLEGVNAGNIWTWVDGEGGTFLIAGRHFVNRIGYLVTRSSWKKYGGNFGWDVGEIRVETFGNQSVGVWDIQKLVLKQCDIFHTTPLYIMYVTCYGYTVTKGKEPMNKMQVTVTIKLDVDPDEWLLFGGANEETDAEVRSTVKNYCVSTVIDQLDLSGFVASRIRAWN